MQELGFPKMDFQLGYLTEILIDWFSVVLVYLAERPHSEGNNLGFRSINRGKIPIFSQPYYKKNYLSLLDVV